PGLTFSDNVLILSLVLPSRSETCRFYLNLHTATVGHLIDEIKNEDHGVEQVQLFHENGQILSKSFSVEALMRMKFTICLNKQRTYLFDPIANLKNVRPKSFGWSKNESDDKAQMTSTNDTVAALYHAINVVKLYNEKQLQLKDELEQLNKQLAPLEIIKGKLASISQRFTSRCVWYGLAGMAFQVGMLAHLTWVDYSWDIVEPISYFIAFSTSMSLYAVYLLTRSDFEYLHLTDRLFLRKFYRESKKVQFDVAYYNQLKNRFHAVNTDLARLRAPLDLSLPAPPQPFRSKISGEEINPINYYATQR
ncbi:unnamed protein product, partial [Didymodactylos carnosus]